MISYLVLLFVPFLFSCVAFTATVREKNRKWSLSVGTDKKILNNSFMLPAFFFLFFLLLALRDESIGRDLENYHFYFDYYSSASLEEVFEEGRDVLYWLLNWVVGQFTKNYQIFLAIVAAITLLPIAKLYCEDREYGFLKIILFVNMSTFIMLFSGLRQSIAMSIGLIAYEFVRKKKLLWFLFTVIIAWGFHHTAFMLFLLYPLYHVTLRKKHLWFVIPLIVAVFAFNKQIFSFMTSVLSSLFGEKYDMVVESTGAITMLVLFILLSVLSYILPDDRKIDRETIGLRNYLLLIVLLQCFAPVHSLAMRMNYYFILFVPILIPKILKNTKYHFGDVAWLAKVVMNWFFLIYYLYTTYVSCQTGISTLDTYPYRFFWE